MAPTTADFAFIKDDRRQLYREFLNYVGHFKPRVFVMENVLGIQSAAGGEHFTRVQHEARLLGYRVVSQVADAFALGVPQKRRRQLIHRVSAVISPDFFRRSLRLLRAPSSAQPLARRSRDLPRLEAGKGAESADYDLRRRERHLAYWRKPARNYLYQVCEVTQASKLTAHRARPHSARDLGDFFCYAKAKICTAMREGVEFEFPYDKSSFKDRYTRQSRRKPCSTIVAHLSKDGLVFIHPTQNRSLTPREAARIQSFPDWFQFTVARTNISSAYNRQRRAARS